jgi:CDP-diacylglycerol--glycerol-3-phosphate 3-phosphatidyltransferase
MNLPNTITIARIVMVPFFLVLAYGDSSAAAVGAFTVFLVASLSDSLDGYLARKHGKISRMGQFLDPLADKLLVGAALVVLVDTRGFPLWAALLIGLREIAVQILRTSIVSGGGTLPASNIAKAKTVVQISMVCWWLLPWGGPNPIHWIYLAASLVTTYWSGAEYFIRAEKHPDEVAT